MHMMLILRASYWENNPGISLPLLYSLASDQPGVSLQHSLGANRAFAIEFFPKIPNRFSCSILVNIN